MLRRVAIVLSSLPAPVASKLLASIGPETKEAVSRTMSNLSDVDPLEQQRAIQAFKVMFQREPAVERVSSEQGDSLQLQSEARIVKNAFTAVPTPTPPAAKYDESTEKPFNNSSPLEFLSNVDRSTLARLLTGEHPQTIALVLASIAPDQAAGVLPRLDARLQQETMSRIGRLGEIPETAIAEVAEHFRSRLDQQSAEDRPTLGRRALDAILAAMPKDEGSPVVNGRGDRSDRERTSHGFPSSEDPAIDLTNRLRVAAETWPNSDPVETEVPADAAHFSANPLGPRNQSSPVSSSPKEVDDRAESASSSAFQSTDSIHRHLIGLSPAELCQALGKVSTRDAILALCGLPVEIVEAALAVLPRAQAKSVRSKMNSLGSLNLREIDFAKEKVAKASLDPLPSPSLQTPAAA
jgi:flagellar motor switch protein FliG